MVWPWWVSAKLPSWALVVKAMLCTSATAAWPWVRLYGVAVARVRPLELVLRLATSTPAKAPEKLRVKCEALAVERVLS